MLQYVAVWGTGAHLCKQQWLTKWLWVNKAHILQHALQRNYESHGAYMYVWVCITSHKNHDCKAHILQPALHYTREHKEGSANHLDRPVCVCIMRNVWVYLHVCVKLSTTATHCNTLQHTTAHCNTLQHTATHCNTLQHTATQYNTLQHPATLCKTPQHTTEHCKTLQHNTLQT